MATTPPAPKRIKREPLTPTTSSSGNVSISTLTVNIKREPLLKLHRLPIPKNGRFFVKPEPVSDKEDEDDELTPPDPDKPKKYKRIRNLDDDADEGLKEGQGISSSIERSKGASGNESDDEDDYVPLVEKVASSSSDDSSDGQQGNAKNKPSSSKRNTRSGQSVPIYSPDKLPKSKRKKNGVKTRRQKVADKRRGYESSDSSESSIISETRSLDGFIVGDDEPPSNPEDVDLSSRETSEPSEHDLIRSTRSKTKKKSGKKSRPKKKESSTSSDVETGSDEDSNSTSSPPRHKSKRDVSRSSESPQKKKPQKDLRNDVMTEIRGIMPGVGVSSRGRRRRKRNRSGAALVHGDESHEEGGENSDDSFIDNSKKEDNTWNLESSSESDQEVVEEDPSILELDSDTFEPAKSSGSEGGDNSSDNSQSSDDDDEAYPARKNIFEHGDILQKCELCINLEDVDVRHRTGVDLEWCTCGACKVVSSQMTNYDRICCKEIKRIQEFVHDEDGARPNCITEHFKFRRYVLEYKAFLRSNKKEKKRLLAEFTRATDKQKVAKCKESFLKWIFGKVEWPSGIPMTVPACVVAKIREKHAKTCGPLYFDPFKVTKVCKFQMHCSNAKNNV